LTGIAGRYAMKAKDIFGIILRVFALWIIVWGAWQITAGLTRIPATIASLFSETATSGINSVVYIFYGLPAFLLGILALRFADAIVAFTYRQRPE
jgi:hypothetical protein